MDETERLDPDTLDEVLERVLVGYPDAAIAAVTPEGSFCDMPSSFETGSRRVMQRGSSAMDFVAPEERPTVIEAWKQARTVGVSRAVLRSATDPDVKETLHLVDAMHRHGVYLAIIDYDGEMPLQAPIEPVRDATKMGRVRKDEVSTIVDLDAGAVELLGFEPDDVTGRRSLDFIHPDDHDRAIDCWMAMLGDPGGVRTVRLRHLRKDGSYLWVDISNRNLLGATEGCVVADMVDVSEEMAAQEALREREQLLVRLTESLPLGVLQIDSDRQVVFANQRFYEITGCEPADGLDEQLATVVQNDREILDEAVTGVLEEGIDQDIQLRARRPGEEKVRLLQVGLRALTSEAGRVTGAVACVEDVTESVLLQLELEHRATQDALTGCFNRASTMGMLDDHLASAFHASSGTALLFFDVDDFKQVNDRLGHAAGDEVLRKVVERAETAIRQHDVLGRLGGDEFLVVCPGIGDEAGAMMLAERMTETVSRPVEWGDEAIDVRISVGVVWCDAQRAEGELLVAHADRLMYEAKHAGSGRPVGRAADARA